MKPLSTLTLLAGLALSTLAQAGTDVGVSVTVREPGFYGRVEIGDRPPPRVIYQQPVIIQQTPVAVVQRPIYLHVPPGHYKRWARYCARYRACGQPVYFVDDPRDHGDYRDGYRDGRRDERRKDRREDRRDDRHDRYHDDHRDHRGGRH